MIILIHATLANLWWQQMLYQAVETLLHSFMIISWVSMWMYVIDLESHFTYLILTLV